MTSVLFSTQRKSLICGSPLPDTLPSEEIVKDEVGGYGGGLAMI